MNKPMLRILTSRGLSLLFTISAVWLGGVQANAQCTELTSGLRAPLGTALTNQGNLLVSETGTTTLHSGRISIIDPSGNRRTLLDGLPSAINDVSEPSGPAGLFMRGRTLYVAMGVGDVGRPGTDPITGVPIPGTTIPNPNPVSSPLFSSILAIQFSASVEKTTNGFTLTSANQQALANGEVVTLANGGDKISIQMIVDFPNYVSLPLPFFAANVQLSNPFQLVAVEDTLYVTDGGRNRVWKINLLTGAVSTLVTFPGIPNPFFGIPGLPGGPLLDPVPTGIAFADDQLLVTLFRGVPFPPGTSTVEQIDPLSGSDTAFLLGLKTAVAILPISEAGETQYLVLQHASVGPFFGSPGLLLHFQTPIAPPTVIANCLTRPTTMALDKKTGTLYISEYGGRIVAFHLPQV
jgi:hypothetical protein